MTKRYLQILSVTAIFAVNGIKSDDSIKTLRKILKKLNAPTEDRYDEANHDSNVVYLPSHYKHAHNKFKHGKSVPNLMNIQTMNLFLKSKRQRDEADQRFLRSDAENTCTAPGRCGCSGGRCGKKREVDLADEVDRVVNEINKQLPRDDEIRNDRDIVTLDDRNWDIDEDDQQRNRDDEDRIKNNDRYYDDGDEINHDRDSDERDRRLVDSKNRVDRDELFNSKRIKINDNLDVVILDKSDLDVLLRNERFPDLTRKDVDKDDEDKEMVEFKKIVNAEDNASDRSTNDITPEEFFGYYEPMKQKLVAKAFNFVKDKKNNNRDKNLSDFFNLKHLSPYQTSELRNTKLKYQRGELKDDALEEEIVNIMFGEKSNMKIVAHNGRNDKIYVPRWLHILISISNKNRNNNLRAQNAQKRVLPLTLQQKERLNKKSMVEKGKTIPKIVWRKYAGRDVQRYGIPFDFDVHGLGQMAA